MRKSLKTEVEFLYTVCLTACYLNVLLLFNQFTYILIHDLLVFFTYTQAFYELILRKLTKAKTLFL